MDQYDRVCYLDMQKTGSTYVTGFLSKHIKGGRKHYEKHGRITAEAYDPSLFYFISVRDPLDMYFSLFNYGLDKKGGFFQSLTEQGLGKLYASGREGFDAWLNHVLDPDGLSEVKDAYDRMPSHLFGFMTFRFLKLSFAAPYATLRKLRDAKDVTDVYRATKIHRAIIHTETLAEDLRRLVVNDLREHVIDFDAAMTHLDSKERLNVSSARNKKATDFASEDTLRRVQARERFMFEELGYPLYVPAERAAGAVTRPQDPAAKPLE